MKETEIIDNPNQFYELIKMSTRLIDDTDNVARLETNQIQKELIASAKSMIYNLIGAPNDEVRFAYSLKLKSILEAIKLNVQEDIIKLDVQINNSNFFQKLKLKKEHGDKRYTKALLGDATKVTSQISDFICGNNSEPGSEA